MNGTSNVYNDVFKMEQSERLKKKYDYEVVLDANDFISNIIPLFALHLI